MKTLNIYGEKDLSSMTLVEITEYNNIIAAAGLKTTKRFASKPKAISKTLQNCAAYLEVEKAEVRNQQGIEKRQKAEANKSTSAEAMTKKEVKTKAKIKAKKVKAKLAAQAKPVKKADNRVLCVSDKTAKSETAMGFVQHTIAQGYNTVETATEYFINNFKQPRGEAKIDRGFARGHIVGAIRLGYLETYYGE